jgi:predicted DNA-binding transcriptional regulator AlpA
MKQSIINDNDIRLISIPEACKRLGIGHWAIYQQISKKSLKNRQDWQTAACEYQRFK